MKQEQQELTDWLVEQHFTVFDPDMPHYSGQKSTKTRYSCELRISPVTKLIGTEILLPRAAVLMDHQFG